MRRFRRHRHASSGRVVRFVFIVALTALIGGLAWQAHTEQRQSVRELEHRFAERIDLATRYVESHISELRGRELEYARSQLGGSVTPEQFDAAVLAFGFEAALLLDDSGDVLAVAPRSPSLVGTHISSQYDHLTTAVAGAEAVSNVVLSAAERQPIVAIAVPFSTPSGRRVFSGGYDLSDSPLRAFLSSASALRGRELYLVDADDQIVASGQDTASRPRAGVAPALAAAATGAHTLDHRDESYFVVVAPVATTPWRLIAAVPAAELHAPARSARVTWGLVAATAAMGLAVLALLRRTYRQRNRLDRLSRTDGLTGLANRSQGEAVLTHVAAASERSGRPWAVALIDVDHFKSVNDRFGHTVGDQVLRHVGDVLARTTRSADVLARWGGEEFILIMEDTDDDAARASAQRLVTAVRNSPTGDGLPLTVSAGTASSVGGLPDPLVSLADGALYAAKAAGRDCVIAAVPDDAGELDTDQVPSR